MLKKTLVAAMICVGAAQMVVAQEQPTAKDLIKWRQSAYSFMGWNYGKIRAELKNPNYNKENVLSSANAIAGVANSGLGALFAPGTEKGEGWTPTKVKPEFFKSPDEVRKVAIDFNKAANNLTQVAATGNKNAVADAADALGKTCKGCHEKFKNK